MEAIYERVLADPLPDGNLGSIRALSPEAAVEMRRLRAAGVPVTSIARLYEISVRAAYRYLVEEELYDAVMDGWRATFAVRPGTPLSGSRAGRADD